VATPSTWSAGVKNCYDLVEIHQKGKFVMVSCQQRSDVLRLEVPGKDSQNLAYLQDLRAKLMMTEISNELDRDTAAEPGALAGVRTLLEAFAQQVEVLERLRDKVHALCCAGHYLYTLGHRQEFDFRDVTSAALARLCALLESTDQELAQWTAVVQLARQRWYFLNFFTMQEVWLLRAGVAQVLDTAAKCSAASTCTHTKKAARAAAKHLAAVTNLRAMLHMVTSSTTVVDDAVAAVLQGHAVAQHVAEVCAPVREPGRSLEALTVAQHMLAACFATPKHNNHDSHDDHTVHVVQCVWQGSRIT
jgi:hypothetical protein